MARHNSSTTSPRTRSSTTPRRSATPTTAFANAERVYKRTLRGNRFVAAPMETRGVLADYERADEKLTVWSSTQMPDLLRMSIATSLGFPAQNLRVIAPHVGGGFGQKMASFPEEIVIPFLALKLGRPVRWIEDRRENLTAALHAKEQVIEVEAALDSEGDHPRAPLSLQRRRWGLFVQRDERSDRALVRGHAHARRLPRAGLRGTDHGNPHEQDANRPVSGSRLDARSHSSRASARRDRA